MFKKSCGGGRKGARDVVILITDGRNMGTPNPQTAAAELKASHGATVITIGIGKTCSLTELKLVASQESLVFTVNTFEELGSILDLIMFVTCTGTFGLVSKNKGIGVSLTFLSPIFAALSRRDGKGNMVFISITFMRNYDESNNKIEKK